MKLTFTKILNSLPAFQKISAADLSLKCNYRVRKFINKVQDELTYFNDENQKLREKYPNLGAEYQEKFKELLDFEIELEYVKPVIHESENIKLSVNDVTLLEEFITFIFEEEQQQ